MAENLQTPGADTVRSPCRRWYDLEAKRGLPRDLMLGLQKMKERAALYLPRNPAELPVVSESGVVVDPWELRVQIARLDNYLVDAVRDVTGAVYSKPPVLSDDMPDTLRDFCDDVDLRGTALGIFALDRSAMAAAEGVSFSVVGFSERPPGEELTEAEEAKLKLSPFWRPYSAESVIDWRFESMDGRPRLMLARLVEPVIVPVGAWGWKVIEQVRVLRAGKRDAADESRWATYELFRYSEEKSAWLSLGAPRSLRPQTEIPLVEWPTDSTAPFESAPMFGDLSGVNLAQFRKQNLLDNGQQIIGFPFAHWAGAPFGQDGKPRAISERRLICSESPQASIEIVEAQGTAWASVQAEIKDMKDSMARMSNAIRLAQSPGSITATGEAIRSAGPASRVAALGRTWEDAAARMLYFTAVYMGLVPAEADEGWGTVEFNRRFLPAATEQPKLEHRKFLYENDLLSGRSLFEAAQGDEIIAEDLDYDDEQKEIEKERPEGLPTEPLTPVPPVPPPPPGQPAQEPGVEDEEPVEAEEVDE